MPSLKSLLSVLRPPRSADLFEHTNPSIDGEACLHDCADCPTYPASLKVDTDTPLYGGVKGWSTHVLVATGKRDWTRDVADEKGSVMEAISRHPPPSNGRLMVSASDMPDAETVLLLPSFWTVRNVRPSTVPQLLSLVEQAPTTTSAMGGWTIPPVQGLEVGACPHDAVVLMCSQATRDARCGQTAPLLRRELERQLRARGLFRDAHDDRPGGVGVFFVSHVGGHKFAANVLVYRRRRHHSLDQSQAQREGRDIEGGDEDGGAAQCVWLGRVRPEDCENLVRYTILGGKVVKPERQLRGGFDRCKGVTSW